MGKACVSLFLMRTKLLLNPFTEPLRRATTSESAMTSCRRLCRGSEATLVCCRVRALGGSCLSHCSCVGWVCDMMHEMMHLMHVGLLDDSTTFEKLETAP
jgi:hypothetical protein